MRASDRACAACTRHTLILGKEEEEEEEEEEDKYELLSSSRPHSTLGEGERGVLALSRHFSSKAASGRSSSPNLRIRHTRSKKEGSPAEERAPLSRRGESSAGGSRALLFRRRLAPPRETTTRRFLLFFTRRNKAKREREGRPDLSPGWWSRSRERDGERCGGRATCAASRWVATCAASRWVGSAAGPRGGKASPRP